MKWSVTRSVAPTSEPLTLVECKRQCRIPLDVSEENGLVEMYLAAARQAFEDYASATAFTSTWVKTQEAFCDEIELPYGYPLQSVSSVKYYDTDGTLQTLSTSVYRVDTASNPGRVVLKVDQSWPDIQSERGQAVEVTYVAGWSAVSSIPAPIRAGMLLMVNHLYENRGAIQVGIGVGAVEVPKTVDWLWAPYQRWAA